MTEKVFGRGVSLEGVVTLHVVVLAVVVVGGAAVVIVVMVVVQLLSVVNVVLLRDEDKLALIVPVGSHQVLVCGVQHGLVRPGPRSSLWKKRSTTWGTSLVRY